MKAEQFKALMANRLPNKPSKPLDGEIVYGPAEELNGCHYWFHSNCRVRGPLNVDEWCSWCLNRETEEEMAQLNPDVPPDTQIIEATIPDDDGAEKKEFVTELQYALHLLNEIRGLLVYLADPKLCSNLQPPDRRECSAKVSDIDALFEDQEYENDKDEDEQEIDLDFEELDLELDSEMSARDAEILNRVVDNLPFDRRTL